MFVGDFNLTLDAKNRIFIPSKIRDELRGELLVIRDFRSPCLKIYTPEEWEKKTESLAELPGKVRDTLYRALYRTATMVTPDSQGRIVLTQALIDQAKIVKDVVIVACKNYAEIWSAELYKDETDHEDMAMLNELLDNSKF